MLFFFLLLIAYYDLLFAIDIYVLFISLNLQYFIFFFHSSFFPELWEVPEGAKGGGSVGSACFKDTHINICGCIY